MEQKFVIIGGSNAIQIQNESPIHGIFDKSTVVNLSAPGLNCKLGDPKCFVDRVPKAEMNLNLMFFISTNKFKNWEYHLYRLQFFECIERLVKEGHDPKRIFVFTPIIRGDSFPMHVKQIFQTDILRIELEKLNVTVISTWDHIPENVRLIRNLFSKNDLRRGKKYRYIHYGKQFRGILHQLMGNTIQNCINNSTSENQNFTFQN